MLALVLALSITPSVFAEETVGSTTNNVDAINGDDTQEGVGTTTDKAYKTEETVGGTTNYVDAINGDDTQDGVGTTTDKAYKTVEAAVAAAKSGDTIQLGDGNYTLYGVSSAGTTNGKNLTFVGHGTDKTGWNIGAKVPDPTNFGTEYNGDYSFDGAKTVTFKNMTLRSGSVDYLGFIRADNTIVENCVVNGMTTFWGYKSAVFKNTTFNCPNDYAIHAYSSPVMLIEKCIFNDAKGKAVKIYNEGGTSINLTFKDNTVISQKEKYAVINVDDRFKNFTVNIIGHNSISGPAQVDSGTCSRLFGFSYGFRNTGNTVVNFNGTTVWKDGKMVDAKAYHNEGVTVDGVAYGNGVAGANDSLYAEGYKDNAFRISTSEWTTNADGTVSRTVTKTCKYCGYQENVTEYQGKLTYDANGGEGAIDSATGAAGESVKVAENVFTRNNYTFTGWNTQADGKGTAYKAGDSFTLTDKDTVLYAQWSKNAPAQVKVSYDANGGTGTMESITGDVGSKIVIEQNGFARSGYTFTGWNTQADGKGTAYKAGNSFTLTDKDTVLYAQWSKNSGSAGTGTKGTAKPTDSPKTGDNSNLALWFALLFVSGGAVTATTIYGRKNKRSVK